MLQPQSCRYTSTNVSDLISMRLCIGNTCVCGAACIFAKSVTLFSSSCWCYRYYELFWTQYRLAVNTPHWICFYLCLHHLQELWGFPRGGYLNYWQNPTSKYFTFIGSHFCGILRYQRSIRCFLSYIERKLPKFLQYYYTYYCGRYNPLWVRIT